MWYIGAHVSAAGGVEKSIIRAHKLGATAFSFFLKNQRQWKNTLLNETKINLFHKFCKLYGYSSNQILPHGNYLMNLGNPDPDMRQKSCAALIDELLSCEKLKLSMLNIHPGSHLKKITEKSCLNNIIYCINKALSKTNNVTIVLENTAGQGSSVGYCFEHLAYIIRYIEDKSRIGVCLDSCHLFSAGYDIGNFSNFLNIFKHFNNIIGINYLCGIHLNDSIGALHSRLDRHQNLGYGQINKEAFSWFMQSIQFQKIPIILETKNMNLWVHEIKWLYKKSLNNQFNII
ncbi:endonuclease IV with intrinsic 3'-5' exonuclease activity [Buchnera aphidicola (Cinara tujafilina)]|uniref:Probable endonuclease 4 n=1 Tax=Buchnera aphidicola (Cinara tujafilina) TaxID=261317 RepID=F7WZ30_9GAMM|nr:deoxyribonuclease IV [Buchnera aphidicola]AEH39680.1 endonuclease IV with intrinsic 3'-5' exonuclease activity [Buchnera aphidicola (Cinara tujafilina)]